jgi:hypothetical protein
MHRKRDFRAELSVKWGLQGLNANAIRRKIRGLLALARNLLGSAAGDKRSGPAERQGLINPPFLRRTGLMAYFL